MGNIDQSIFSFFHNLAGQSRIGDFLIVFFGEYFLYILLVVFSSIAFLNWRKGNIFNVYPYAIALVAAIVARFVVASSIRFFYHNPRPFLTLDIPHLLNGGAFSFPSGHIIFLFALAGATYFFNKKLAYFVCASGIIIGFARIAGGVHWPSDILGGIILGIPAGFLVFKLLGQRFPVEKTTEKLQPK